MDKERELLVGLFCRAVGGAYKAEAAYAQAELYCAQGIEIDRNERRRSDGAKQAQTEAASSVAEVATEISPIVNAEEQPATSPIQRRVSSKQRKLSLEEYRKTFMRPYKIEDRKPVFISGKLRKMLDKFACKIGEDRMSMSGLLENIVSHHIELYSEDFEHWKGM